MSVWTDIQSRSAGNSIRKEDFDLDNMLKLGIVHFKYKKILKKGQTDDTKAVVRDAWGTKKMDIVDSIPHGGDCPPKRVGYTIYFDVEKADWRAFLDSRVIYVDEKIYSDEEFFNKIYPTLKGDKK